MRYIKNAYCVVHFACCRAIKAISELELEKITKEFQEVITKQEHKILASEVEESKEPSGKRGATSYLENPDYNLCFIFGCQAAYAVNADSKFIADIIKLYHNHFDSQKGELLIPDVFSNVVSQDARFEVVSTVEAKKLALKR